MRLCFNRKNKTLGGIFKQSNVVKLLEDNYKTYCALHNKDVDLTLDMKEHVLGILSSNEFNEMRSSKMDVDDFLRLLNCFNEKDIHFT